MAKSAFKWLCMALIAGLVNPACYALQSSSFYWDPNQEPYVSGYILYFGDSSGCYTHSIDAGNVTTATVSNLVEGATYYFAVRAYDAAGFQSGPSN
jgi:hypothetical protein